MSEISFIAYLESKNHSAATQKATLRHVNKFAQWYGMEAANCTKKDILKYLEYLQTTKKQENATRRNALIALNHYFTFLVHAGEVAQNPTTLFKIRGTQKTYIHNLYTSIELEQLHDNFYHFFIRNFDHNHIPRNQQQQSFLSRQRNYIMLGMLIYQGLHTNELQKISLADIDLNKATVKIQGGKKCNDRKIQLNAQQTGSLINYINTIRPQFFDFCAQTDTLFFALPESGKRQTTATTLMHTIKPLTKQVKTIDKKFVNFMQIRSSVITHWLKTHGLRHTQYLAGHKYAHSTESYLTGDLETLSAEIARFNPF